MTQHRKAHREICHLCHEVSRVGFHVPDDIWQAAMHKSDWNNIVCLSCFARLADERGVEWDNDIAFYPVSRISHDKFLLRDKPRRLEVID